MLRITRTNDANGSLLQLEGKLIAEWVGELSREINGDLETAASICLDLAQVHFVDRAGHALLLDLLQRGVKVASCSSYLSELLHLEAI